MHDNHTYTHTHTRTQLESTVHEFLAPVVPVARRFATVIVALTVVLATLGAGVGSPVSVAAADDDDEDGSFLDPINPWSDSEDDEDEEESWLDRGQSWWSLASASGMGIIDRTADVSESLNPLSDPPDLDGEADAAVDTINDNDEHFAAWWTNTTYLSNEGQVHEVELVHKDATGNETFYIVAESAGNHTDREIENLTAVRSLDDVSGVDENDVDERHTLTSYLATNAADELEAAAENTNSDGTVEDTYKANLASTYAGIPGILGSPFDSTLFDPDEDDLEDLKSDGGDE